MSDKLYATDPTTSTPDDPKKDPIDTCCVVPPGGGDPGPGGTMVTNTES